MVKLQKINQLSEQIVMFANYHTHTYRCGHATGSEREYVEKALQAGIRILGFSDHTPYDFYDSEPRNRPIRMKPEELPGYAASIRSLAEEYRDRIEIHLGVEAEYYPKYFPRLLEMLRENGVEYMILGQHFLDNEIRGWPTGRPFLRRSLLEKYVNQTLDALETGLFTYFAHPDIIRFMGTHRFYDHQMRRLCQGAKRAGVPLEINLLGIREGRNYPNERFWKIAAEIGNEVILGSDAHEPRHLLGGKDEETALELIGRLGLKRIETVKLRKI